MCDTPKILIVDDEPRMCESLKTLLCLNRYAVETAANGREAFASLRRKKFDLVFLDIGLPDMSGHRVMDHIHENIPETPVIMITGNASIESVVSSIKRGAYDYLKKPFDHEELSKKVENALEQRRLKNDNSVINKKLEESEERYRFLVQNSPDLIYTLDQNGQFSFANKTFHSLLGYDCKQIVGMHYSAVIHKDDRQKATYCFDERRTGERSTSSLELRLTPFAKECDSNAPKRNHAVIELNSTGLYDGPVDKGDKRFVGTYGVGRDITDRILLESQLRQAGKMEALGRLAGGVAHDFNNILTGIMGYVCLMLLDMDDTHEHAEKLLIIKEQIQSAAKLIKQLLGFSRGGKYHVKPIALDTVVQKITDMFVRTRKEVAIHLNCEEGIFPVEADLSQIEQVFLNLYVNACQAMDEGGNIYVNLTNVIICRNDTELLDITPGNYVSITVADTGSGMDEETRQRIFDPFFTTKEKGRGSGLGLASVYGIIKNHGGSISVYSREGKGTTFTIYLPASEKKVAQEKRPVDTALKGTETVLLVDDEEVIRDAGARILQHLGYKPLTASSAKEAVELYRVHKDEIALVLLDMIMPGKGGKDIYAMLKLMNSDIKVILSSGYSLNGQAAEIIEQGCNDFMQKPFTIKELSIKLREVLDADKGE